MCTFQSKRSCWHFIHQTLPNQFNATLTSFHQCNANFFAFPWHLGTIEKWIETESIARNPKAPMKKTAPLMSTSPLSVVRVIDPAKCGLTFGLRFFSQSSPHRKLPSKAVAVQYNDRPYPQLHKYWDTVFSRVIVACDSKTR